MNSNQIIDIIYKIIEETKSAVFITACEDGRPGARWMTPCIFEDMPGKIFAVTSPNFDKMLHIFTNPQVEWLIQNPSLSQIVNIRGKVSILDNPSIKAKVIDLIGDRLSAFWKINRSKIAEYVVLETVIKEAVYYEPLNGTREIVKF